MFSSLDGQQNINTFQPGAFRRTGFFAAMLPDYIPVLIQILIAGAFAGATLIASALLGKRATSNPVKDSAYECGMNPLGDGQARFSVKFYLVAMLFVLFDIEVVFLFPWAAVYRNEISQGEAVFFWSMLSFVIILFLGYLYAWRKGAFEWRN